MKISSLFTGLALILVASASNATLLTNGGFESGLTGWICTAPAGGCFTGTQSGIAAVEGSSYFYGFDNGTGGMNSQAFATDVGATYSISFWFNTNGAVPPNGLDVSVGDLAAIMPLETATWNMFSSNFMATSTSTTVDFGFITIPGTGTVFIDDVIVAAVPEPTSLALLGLGLGLLGMRRARRI